MKLHLYSLKVPANGKIALHVLKISGGKMSQMPPPLVARLNFVVVKCVFVVSSG